jgi:hypothetical protein
MSGLIRFLNQTERDTISQELKRLFVLHDRQASEEKIKMFVDEIEKWGFEPRYILQGISNLFSVDLKNIKLATLKESIQDQMPVDSFNSKDKVCPYCEGVGTIAMNEAIEGGYGTVFACNCAKGKALVQSLRMATWSGAKYQDHNGKKYKVRFPQYQQYPMAGKEYL